jgi:hypothetical protein
MNNVLLKVNAHFSEIKLQNKTGFLQCGKGSGIGSAYDYEAQSAIVPYVGVMIKKGCELI